MINNSECGFFELHINDFLSNNLVGDNLNFFLNHISNCPTCYEELETQYLLSEVLLRLEDGETIDLRKELEYKINSSRKILHFHYIFESIFHTIDLLSGVVIAFGLYGLIRMFLGI